MSNSESSHHHVSFAARSDVGMKRAMNQDAFEVVIAPEGEWAKRGHCFIVADGMGAHAAGELASSLAVEEFRREYDASESEPRGAIVDALQHANSVIHNKGQADTQLFNMGTTCSSLVILPDGALVGHVGDSRVYRNRGNQIQQLTFDHSLVWEMRAAGQLTDDRNATIPRNVITRCLGPHSDVEVDIEGYFSIREGDTFLLCSDGLTGRISDEEIGVIIRHLQPQEAVDFLTDLANVRGGSDNITVIVVRVDSEELRADGEVSDTTPRNSGGGTHPAWWLVAGIGLLASLLGLQFANPPIAVSGGAVFLVAVVGAVTQWYRQHNTPQASQYPTTPYATASAAMNQEFVDGICDSFELMLNALLPTCPDLSSLQEDLVSIKDQTLAENVTQEAATNVCHELASIARQLRGRL